MLLITTTYRSSMAWIANQNVGGVQESWIAETEESPLDGDIVISIKSAQTGDPLRIPPYLPAKYIEGFMRTTLGIENVRVTAGARLS